MSRRRRAVCPLCDNAWKVTTKKNGKVVDVHDPVDAVAEVIERKGCASCYLLGRGVRISPEGRLKRWGEAAVSSLTIDSGVQ